MKFLQVRKQLKEADGLLNQMSTRLHDHQRQIEVMGEALNRKDGELLKFVDKLHENMGGTLKLSCEADALSRLRVIRDQAERYTAIMDVIHGTYDADETLRKRIACALGTASFDVHNIISRAGNLAAAHSRELALKRELADAKAEIEELESEVLGDGEWD